MSFDPFQRLDEVLRDIRNAAQIIGAPVLVQKWKELRV